jgi:glycosyltransferase involved in cell wall biosynthesis
VEFEFDKLRAAGLSKAFQYAGAVDRRGKLEFLQGIDLLSVPTTYREPKGLFVLEALAAGVPVVQPAHGAFPELLADLGGGRLVPPNDPLRLTDALEDLLGNEEARNRLGRQGARAVHSRFNAEAMARATWAVCQQFLDD